jgi:hypothetical protein
VSVFKYYWAMGNEITRAHCVSVGVRKKILGLFKEI